MLFNSTLSLVTIRSARAIPTSLFQNMMLTVSVVCIMALFYVNSHSKPIAEAAPAAVAAPAAPRGSSPFTVNGTAGSKSTNTVSALVTDALAFKALMNTTQLAALQLNYSTTLARKWSNLPCGTSCRNGVQIGSLTGTTYQAAMKVIADALSATSENGYDEYYQTCLAEAYLHANGGGSGYDSTLRWMAFLNTPSATGAWMLQFGGHHYAANIAFNNGHVIGATPFFMGTEPKSFTYNNKSCAPLNSEHDAFANVLGSLTSTQVSSAKITQSFSDCYMIPGESSGGSYSFPTTKAGLQCSNLTAAQKALLLTLFQNYTGDMDSATAANTQAVYASEIDNSYIAFVGSGTAGTASTFLNAQGNYARVDGPHIWLEFSCQAGVVISGQIHYHTVWRDHSHDYGVDLTGAAIDEGTVTPLKLLSFTAGTENKVSALHWITTNEINVSHFEVQQSTNYSRTFLKIGSVTAKNTNGENRYSFAVSTPLAGAPTYFRLRMTDKDGRAVYSNVAILRPGSSDKFSLANTVVANELVINHPSTYTNSMYRILNLQGQVMIRGRLQEGVTNTGINVSPLRTGQYVISIINNNEKLTAKFFKQ